MRHFIGLSALVLSGVLAAHGADGIHQIQESLALPDLERTMRIEKQYLNFPVRNGAEMRHLTLTVDGQRVLGFDIELADEDPDFWTFIDVTAFRGQSATLRTDQPPDSNPDVLETVVQSDTIVGADDLYREKHRPQFHFSSRRGWINDPNGLVFYDGEYHLFYQHNPFGIRWGNMHWGHAVSTDLVHWQELPEALMPDEQGTMFSGSAVVDHGNTAGFQTGDEKAIVCIYTVAGSTSPESKDQPFTQCIAYSIDRGRTWMKYAGNPVLGHVVGTNRDPKVIGHDPSNQWVMALYLDKQDYALYASPDLKQWTEFQRFDLPGASECPDFFELPIDGDAGNTRWLFWGANGTYLLGSFDGKTFQADGPPLKYDWGGNSYAAQTFSDIPEAHGRRIQICWLRVDLPDMPFNQMMTFPCELTLRTTGDGVRLFSEPVREIESLHRTRHAWEDEPLRPGDNPLSALSTPECACRGKENEDVFSGGIAGDTFHIRADVRLADAKMFGFTIRGIPVRYDVKKRQLSCAGKKARLEPIDGRIRLEILVDRPSLEIFGNDGLVYLPLGVISETEDLSLTMFATGGAATIVSLEVFDLQSAWER